MSSEKKEEIRKKFEKMKSDPYWENVPPFIQKEMEKYVAMATGEKSETAKIDELKSGLMIVLGFLNKPCEIKTGDRFYPFLEEVKKVETEITGLTFGKCRIWEYGSGRKCLFDALFTTFDELQLWPKILKRKEKSTLAKNTPLHRKIISALLLIPRLLVVCILFLFLKFSMIRISKKILGQYDFIEKIPFSVGEIRIVTSNIQKCAKNRCYNLSGLEKYVVLHEDIHNGQALNFPMIDEKKRIGG